MNLAFIVPHQRWSIEIDQAPAVVAERLRTALAAAAKADPWGPQVFPFKGCVDEHGFDLQQTRPQRNGFLTHVQGRFESTPGGGTRVQVRMRWSWPSFVMTGLFVIVPIIGAVRHLLEGQQPSLPLLLLLLAMDVFAVLIAWAATRTAWQVAKDALVTLFKNSSAGRAGPQPAGSLADRNT